MKFLLDTNALSEPRRVLPDGGYMTWFWAQSADDLAISVLTFGELRRGVAALDPGRRRYELTAWLARGVAAFGDRILPVDIAVASAWADIAARNRDLGRPVGMADELIAATARVHGCIVVTRNVRDFETSGCQLLSPWSS